VRRAILDAGTSYHAESIHGRHWCGRFGRVIYAPDLAADELVGIDVLVVPDRTHPAVLRAKRPVLLDLLQRGGSLIVFAETGAPGWLPRVAWRFAPTNFWWWRQGEAAPAVEIAEPRHGLFAHLGREACVWHHHGTLLAPPGAQPMLTLAGTEGPECLMYEDRASSPGRLILATLDPFYHHGSHFMPATTLFLDGFVRWLEETWP
jgi:hypothetical protein